ncbi:MAG: hypothetical protein JEZ08_24335 [Clostridiales bacterium]|nr:hypothetical protein [Clostridiales bacterium]
MRKKKKVSNPNLVKNNEIINHGENTKNFFGNGTVYNDHSVKNEKIVYSENKIEVEFDEIEIRKTTLDVHDNQMKKISLLTGVIGLLTVCFDFIYSHLTNNGNEFSITYVKVAGLAAITISMLIIIKFVFILRIKNESRVEFGTSYRKNGKEVTLTTLKAKCLKCGGEIRLKKAKYETIINGEVTIVTKYIGVCKNSNKYTKHYYKYDDITKKGKVIEDDELYKYRLS